MLKKFFLALMIMLLPLTASAKSQDVTIDGDHGKLSAIIQIPDDREKFPLVMILHGFTGNKNGPLIKGLADDLEARGIASIRFDFNGHGQSEGDFQDMTVPNEIVDAKKVYDYVRSLPNVTTISVAGHSQGSVVSSMLAGELGAKKIKCVVLMAPAPILRDDSIRGKLFDIQYDPKNPPEFVEIFGGRKVGRNYILTAQTLPIFDTSKKFTGSVLMIHGTGDVIAPYTYSLYYNEIYKRGEVKLIDGADHGFSGCGEQVTQFAADFFARRLKK